MDSKHRAPIIIIGMHRSGTSMITTMLEQLGLFMGRRKQGDEEAVLFLSLNEWMLRQSGGAWDQPEPVKYLLNNPDVRPLVVDYLQFVLKTPRALGFLGLRNYLRYNSPLNVTIPWGWKDPRNTFTLPVWLDIFPGAKVVHIYRHGLDVCHSLVTRMQKALHRASINHSKYGKKLGLYWFYSRRAGFTDSLRCAASLEDSFALWEAYIREAHQHVTRLGDRAIEIKYEDFLANPGPELARLAEFCDLPVESGALTALTTQVRPDRAYAYRQVPELCAFAEQVQPRLAAAGY